jgi:hypothetical protein
VQLGLNWSPLAGLQAHDTSSSCTDWHLGKADKDQLL